MLKKIIAFTILIFSHSIMAEDESGCLIQVKQSFKVDPKCACIAAGNCAKIRNFNYSESMYNSVDRNKRAIFNSNEKAKMKESMALYDQIVKLKLKGQGNSDEIKALYLRLDKLNSEVRKSFLKTQTRNLQASKEEYKKTVTKITDRDERNFKRALDIVKNQTPAESTNNMAEKKAVPAPKKSTLSNPEPVAVTKLAPIKETKNYENEAILKNLKPERLERNDDDSLFDIISKSYKKTAYPKLLAP